MLLKVPAQTQLVALRSEMLSEAQVALDDFFWAKPALMHPLERVVQLDVAVYLLLCLVRGLQLLLHRNVNVVLVFGRKLARYSLQHF